MPTRAILPLLRDLRRSLLHGRLQCSRVLRLHTHSSKSSVQQSSQRSRKSSHLEKWLPAVPTTVIAATATLPIPALCEADEKNGAELLGAGRVDDTLPTFSWAQVQQHTGSSNSSSDGIWVVYNQGVYDVSEFAHSHPGRTKVLKAAGKSLELFWERSDAHKRPVALKTLETLRIGNLRPQDVQMLEETKQLARHDAGPTASSRLERLFFLKSTEEPTPVPSVESADFRLTISSSNGTQEDSKVEFLTLKDLHSRFKQHSVTTTTQCARPRASDGSSDGNTGQSRRVPATWTGVLLADVLAELGFASVAVNGKVAHQVRFEALDRDAKGNAFGASIAAATALDEECGVLLAFKMDGQPIPREHGYPLRVIVPGTTGTRNVKFVHRILVQ